MNEKNRSLNPSPQHSATKMTESVAGREVSTSHSTSAEQVAEQTRAEVFGAMTLAKQFPRDEESSRTSIIQACKSLKFAEKAVFKKPVGNGKFIEGPSIRFAEEIIRHWGNVKSFKSVIYDDPSRRIIRVVCYDLQANISYSEDAIIDKSVERKFSKGREVISERMNSYGEKVSLVVATEDEMLIKEGAKTSKMIRNTGLRLIPGHITEEAIEAAQQIIRGGLAKNIDVSINKILESFGKLGVKSPDLEKYLGHAIAQITVDDIADLKKVIQAIKDKEAKWSDFVSAEVKEPDQKEKETGAADPSEFFTPGDAEDHVAVDKPATEKK